jgi:hypothetical protein
VETVEHISLAYNALRSYTYFVNTGCFVYLSHYLFPVTGEETMVIDTATLILTALGTGATTARAKKNKAVEETYTRLKALIQKKFTGNAEAMFVLDKYEAKPDIWEAPLKDELLQANADEDKEIIQTAKMLMTLQESQQKADYERIAIEADGQRRQLQRIYEQHYHRFERRLHSSLIAVVMGLSGITAGVFTILIEKMLIGLVIIAIGLIAEVIAALFALRAKESKKRADGISNRLKQWERIYESIELALMTDDETRKRLQGLIIERLLDLANERQAIDLANSTCHKTC